MKFDDLISLLDRVQNEKTRSGKIDVIRQVPTDLTIIKLLLRDFDGRKLGVGVTRLASYYTSALAIKSGGVIDRWYDPAYTPTGVYGDFGEVLSRILSMRGMSTVKNDVSVYDVDRWLNAFESGHGITVVKELVNVLSVSQHKWFCRIVLSDMHIGIGTEVILKEYPYPGALGDFESGSTVEELFSSVKHQHGLRLFVPFSPMLSFRGTMKYCSTLPLGEYIVEQKYDGWRVLVHVSVPDRRVRFYSRQRKEVTEWFSSLSNNVVESIIQANREAVEFASQTKNIVLDAEIIPYDSATRTILPLTDMRKPGVSHVLKVFDIPFRNDGDIRALSLSRRKQMLLIHVSHMVGSIELINPIYRIRNTRTWALNDVMKSIVSSKAEGIIIKNVHSPYGLGETGRRTRDWVKFKPDYATEGVEPLKMAIMGGNYTNDRASRHVSEYVVGVINGDRLMSVCKVRHGLSIPERKRLDSIIGRHWIRSNKCRPHRLMVFGSSVPDVWIKPHDTMVLHVHGFEATSSRVSGSLITIRFPRIIGFSGRDDVIDIESLRKRMSDGIHLKTFSRDVPAESLDCPTSLSPTPEESGELVPPETLWVQTTTTHGNSKCSEKSSENSARDPTQGGTADLMAPVFQSWESTNHSQHKLFFCEPYTEVKSRMLQSWNVYADLYEIVRTRGEDSIRTIFTDGDDYDSPGCQTYRASRLILSYGGRISYVLSEGGVDDPDSGSVTHVLIDGNNESGHIDVIYNIIDGFKHKPLLITPEMVTDAIRLGRNHRQPVLSNLYENITG